MLNFPSCFCFSGPAVFRIHPVTKFVSSESLVQLSCSYNNYTSVSFSWMVDNGVLNVSGLASVSTTREWTDVVSGIYKDSTSVQEGLHFTITNVNEQGLYWCKLEDSLKRVVESNKASVKLLGKLFYSFLVFT